MVQNKKESFSRIVEDLEKELSDKRMEYRIGLKYRSDYGLEDRLFKFNLFHPNKNEVKYGDYISIRIEVIELNEYKDSTLEEKRDLITKILDQITCYNKLREFELYYFSLN